LEAIGSILASTGLEIDVNNAYIKTKNAYHHGDLRAALIQAAADVAAREGVSAIQMRPLARALGVSSGAPFRHFRSIDALLVAVAEEGADRQLEAMRAAADPLSDPAEQQRQMAVAYVRWCVAEPGYFRVLTRVESLEGSERLQAQQAAFTEQLGRVLSTKSTEHAPLSADSAAVLGARALVYGLAKMAVDGFLGRDISPDHAARVADQVTRAVSFRREEKSE
jgi:AcrR family transcriptional regulator